MPFLQVIISYDYSKMRKYPLNVHPLNHLHSNRSLSLSLQFQTLPTHGELNIKDHSIRSSSVFESFANPVSPTLLFLVVY